MENRSLTKLLVVIVGPTGAGKSALALNISAEIAGEVVNCDSLQLYRGFDVGTAKVPVSERRGIPHHMIDVLDPQQGYSAGEYARLAREAIAGVSERGRVPVIVGGTGFYLRAVLNGLPPLPMRDRDLRLRLSDRETRRAGSLHHILTRIDPDAAQRIHVRDTQKLIRALEIRLLTSAPLPSTASAEPLQGYTSIKIGLNPDRAVLYKLLDARAREMFRSGLIEEVTGLLVEGACTGREKPFESLGYKQALRYLGGAITLDQAIESTQIETRQYAKRQWTWFRRDLDVHWLSGFGHSISIFEQSMEFIRKLQ
jgi:tRNA dimethylallyltransferase